MKFIPKIFGILTFAILFWILKIFKFINPRVNQDAGFLVTLIPIVYQPTSKFIYFMNFLFNFYDEFWNYMLASQIRQSEWLPRSFYESKRVLYALQLFQNTWHSDSGICKQWNNLNWITHPTWNVTHTLYICEYKRAFFF